MKPSAHARRRGHSLLEVSVAMFLVAVVSGLAVRASGPFTAVVADLRTRVDAAQELRLATDWLARDLGAAEEAAIEGDDLVLRREAALTGWLGAGDDGHRGRGHDDHGGVDPGLTYSLRDGNLLRRDALTGEEVVVATGITGFDLVRRRTGRRELRITLEAGDADAPHSVTLVWRSR